MSRGTFCNVRDSMNGSTISRKPNGHVSLDRNHCWAKICPGRYQPCQYHVHRMDYPILLNAILHRLAIRYPCCLCRAWSLYLFHYLPTCSFHSFFQSKKKRSKKNYWSKAPNVDTNVIQERHSTDEEEKTRKRKKEKKEKEKENGWNKHHFLRHCVRGIRTFR